MRVWPSAWNGALTPYICGGCGVLWNAAAVDGAWLGRAEESGWPGALTDFVEMRAATLRLQKPTVSPSQRERDGVL